VFLLLERKKHVPLRGDRYATESYFVVHTAGGSI
jgi:hypothetical protein